MLLQEEGRGGDNCLCSPVTIFQVVPVDPAEVKGHVTEELAEVKDEVTVSQIQRIIPLWFQIRTLALTAACAWGWGQGQAFPSLLLFLPHPTSHLVFVCCPC